MNLKVDFASLFKEVGKVGGAILIMFIASIVLAIAAMSLLISTPILLAVALATPIVLIPFAFRHFSRLGGQDVSKKIEVKLPLEISAYIKDFPAYAINSDLTSGYVKTSAESFMYLARAIFQNIKPGSEVNATDRVTLSEFDSEYWHHGGLAYLESHFTAIKRGVVFNRYFIVRADEIEPYAYLLEKIITLNAMCGIRVYVVRYEDLPINQRREIAVFGNIYSDEVSYDVYGKGIVENKVYFSREKYAELSELIRATSHMATPYQHGIERVKSFEKVLDYARSVRAELAVEGRLPAIQNHPKRQISGPRDT